MASNEDSANTSPNPQHQQHPDEALLLPPPPSQEDTPTQELAVGSTIKLDRLGPLVVNADGVNFNVLEGVRDLD